VGDVAQRTLPLLAHRGLADAGNVYGSHIIRPLER